MPVPDPGMPLKTKTKTGRPARAKPSAKKPPPVPKYRFRILCKRCSSYMHTTLHMADYEASYIITCSRRGCGNEAEHIDAVFEEREPK